MHIAHPNTSNLLCKLNPIFDVFKFYSNVERKINFGNWHIFAGLCVRDHYHQAPDQFCYEEALSFTWASLFAPAISLTIIYLPTIIYVIFLSIRFYGFKNFLGRVS